MKSDRRPPNGLTFSPLPGPNRMPMSVLGGNFELSGSENVVGLGALCDFVRSPQIGDRTVSFRISEYCALDDGRTYEIRDLGFNLSTTFYTGIKPPDPDPTEELTIEILTEEVLHCTGPEARSDGSLSEEEHDWEELALCAQHAGLKVTGMELRALGYSVTFTDRVKQRIQRS